EVNGRCVLQMWRKHDPARRASIHTKRDQHSLGVAYGAASISITGTGRGFLTVCQGSSSKVCVMTWVNEFARTPAPTGKPIKNE
ncbi:MAG: hypothetical protein VX607_09745, partial [Planctomycetota bacterium]|nr:hypothetical protein [Planctomycetota bacterium]